MRATCSVKHSETLQAGKKLQFPGCVPFV